MRKSQILEEVLNNKEKDINNLSITLTKEQKRKLDEICKSTKQERNFILGKAIEYLYEELNELKELYTDTNK